MEDIKLIVLDVDGTLTDGKIYYDNKGNEIKCFNVKDGMGIGQAIKTGIDIAIITGRNSKIVERRAQELGVKYVYQGIHNKLDCLLALLKKLNLMLDNVMYIGDDINDLDVMNSVKYRACPEDAVQEIKSVCEVVSNYKGGEGAVREIIEIVLKKQGKWSKLVEEYYWVMQ